MIDNVLLYAFLGCALAGAAAMLVLRHPMRVALALVATMLALAGVYAMLGAHAIAVFQVLIYVGAVMVFMVYVIMLLDVRDASLARRFSWLAAPAAVGFLALLGLLGHDVWQGLRAFTAGAALGVQPFAVTFLNDYWLHFELVSVLLVAAVVAALAVIRVGRAHG
ncbi:MAG TPA: NADH-quinone oxidoreductase subunit J [Usitatibacter sp.]|jgi:NADH-quinone oxidoreductase subunit J|nr:NADH-quinone oxidoreductase subunit J [Usitatibacter sp.]